MIILTGHAACSHLRPTDAAAPISAPGASQQPTPLQALRDALAEEQLLLGTSCATETRVEHAFRHWIESRSCGHS